MTRLSSLALPARRRLLSSSTRRLASPSTTTKSTTTTTSSRLTRLESRLPRFLRTYTTRLRTAPLSHITAFLVLHELTALVPLLGLAALFHYTNWLPPYISEGAWVALGIEKFGRYLRRKGWLSESDELELELAGGAGGGGGGKKEVWFTRGEGGVRVVVELATAWALTKALLPVRLAFSVWATPWFARVGLMPVWRGVKRVFGSGGKGKVSSSSSSGPAKTGAVGGGVAPKTGGAGGAGGVGGGDKAK